MSHCPIPAQYPFQTHLSSAFSAFPPFQRSKGNREWVSIFPWRDPCWERGSPGAQGQAGGHTMHCHMQKGQDECLPPTGEANNWIC